MFPSFKTAAVPKQLIEELRQDAGMLFCVSELLLP